MKRMWLLVMPVAMLTVQSPAGIAIVDFGPAGDAYADVPESYNNFSGTGTKSLLDTTGASSGISLQYEIYGGSYNYASGTARTPVAGISTNLTADRIYAGTGGVANVGEFGFTLTVSGLDPDGTCSIAVLPSQTGISSTWRVEAGAGGAAEYLQDATASTNLFEWKDIVPETNGAVVITGRAFSNLKWKSVGLSGLIISAVPAPLSVGFTWIGSSNVTVNARGMNVDHQYSLEVCTNLMSGIWEPVEDTVFEVKAHTWNGGEIAPYGFYRLLGQDKKIDMMTIRSQFIDYYTRFAPSEAEIQGNLDTMLADGTWADVDYANQDPASWPTTLHLSRLLSMAESYADPASSFYQDPVLLDAILRGLQHWLDYDYTNPNWFTWKISVPLYFLRTFVLLDEDLPPAMYTEARWKIFSSTAMDMTGANQVSLATKVFLIGLLEDDIARMHEASVVLWNELYVTTNEGIQPDWSFHQHGPQQQFGNYGLGMSAMMIEQGLYMRDTMYAPVADRMEILRNCMLEGESWVLWAGRMDISALGRMIYPQTQELKGTKLKGQLLDMIDIDPVAIAQYEQVLAPTNSMIGHKSFWRSDMAVHRRPDWYCSVKMCSTRVVGTETANNQNLLGIHLADGVQYVYQDSGEYENVMGLWDWHRLPGSTCDQGMHSLKPLGYDKDYGGSDVVGVVNDGTNGVAAMIYKRKLISARKAWFFGEDSVVCLGAGIGGTSLGPIFTSVQQAWLNGPVVASAGTLSVGTNTLSTGEWVQHNGIGYRMLQDATVHFGTVTGDWKDINSTFDDGPVTGEVFSIWVDHGVSPSNAGYAYTVYPRTEASDMDARIAADDCVILSNTDQLQAVESAERGAEAVFYSAGQLVTTDGTVIETDTPCILCLNGNRLIVAEPTQTKTSLTVAVNGRPYDALLPVGGFAGSSVELRLTDAP